jgi:membrane-bound lytic murein transglycosylase A
MRARRVAVFLTVALAIALGAVLYSCNRTVPPKLTLKPLGFDQLADWGADNIAAAVPAFRRSCAVITTHSDAEPFDPTGKSGDFGTVGDWRELCDAAAKLPGTAAATRAFFEANFVPLLAGNNGDIEGLFTGYFEVVLNGALHQEGPFQTPLYRLPPDPKAYTRAQIETGALDGKGLELVWVDDPFAAFSLAIQGSGLVRLKGGGTLRLGYAGSNGQRYVAIGRLLVERKEIALKDLTMESLRVWITTHGEAGKALMRENPSYVFFQVIPGDGPLGSEKVVLTAKRSLAVDRRFIPLGMPLWLDATERFGPGTIRRLVIAQDTGGAIKGPVRGDLYWGSGDAAGQKAGMTNATGHYCLLVPRAVVPRALAAAGAD